MNHIGYPEKKRAPKGAIWPVDSSQSPALRKELYDYYWPKLRMLWRPKTFFHWAKTVQLISYFNNDLKYPIPQELITAAINYGHSHSKYNKKEIVTIREIILARIWLPMNPDTYYNVLPHGTLLSRLEAMKKQLEDVDWLPRGHDKSDLYFTRLDREERLSKSLYGEMKGCGYPNIDGMHPENPLADRNYWGEREVIEEARRKKLRELDIHLKDVPRDAVDNDNTNPECIICQEPLVDSKELHRMFARAATLDNKQVHDEAWSEAFEEGMQSFSKARGSCDDGAEDALIQEILKPVHDLQHAYYRLKAAREELPGNFCVQAVKLKCGHQSFGKQCITTWVTEQHYNAKTQSYYHNMTCPLCRQRINEDAIPLAAEIIQIPSDEEQEEIHNSQAPLIGFMEEWMILRDPTYNTNYSAYREPLERDASPERREDQRQPADRRSPQRLSRRRGRRNRELSVRTEVFWV